MLRLARRAALTLLGSAAIVSLPAQSPPPLRVMTWNIAAGHGDLAGIADVIRAADADVVALQEVDVHWSARSGFADQATDLGRALGMQVRFGPIYRLAGADAAPMREFGLAILSRLPIVEFRNHVIPRLSTQSAAAEPELLPGFPEAVLDVAGERVSIFATHLDYRPDPAVRAAQVAAMLAIVTARDHPVVLMGDLNAPPVAPELAPLFAALRDVWPRAGDPGFTYPADTPVRRIDYILVPRHLRATDVRVLPGEASDHRAVVATLSR